MASLNLTFLGTATSVGVPMIGCDCETCRSNDPRDKRLRSSIYVTTPECSWVVDTGPDFRTQCLRENIRRVDAVLLSHPHMDHLTGFDELRRFTIDEDALMPVYAMPATVEAIKRVFFFAFNPAIRYRGYLKAETHTITGPFRLGNTDIIPLPVKHGSAETIGFLFQREGRKLCGYISDMKEPFPETLERLQGVDTLICDGLRHTPHPTHMNLEEALRFSAQVAPRQTWLTHLQCEILHARDEPTLPSGVNLAYDGLKLSW